MADFWGNLLALSIIISLIIVAYLKYTNKKLPDLIQEIKALFSSGEEE